MDATITCSQAQVVHCTGHAATSNQDTVIAAGWAVLLEPFQSTRSACMTGKDDGCSLRSKANVLQAEAHSASTTKTQQQDTGGPARACSGCSMLDGATKFIAEHETCMHQE